jgi:hypothetical protein
MVALKDQDWNLPSKYTLTLQNKPVEKQLP